MEGTIPLDKREAEARTGSSSSEKQQQEQQIAGGGVTWTTSSAAAAATTPMKQLPPPMDADEPCFKAVAFGRNYFHGLGGTTVVQEGTEGGDSAIYEWSAPPWVQSNNSHSNSSAAKAGSSAVSPSPATSLRSSASKTLNALRGSGGKTAAITTTTPPPPPDAGIRQALATAQSTVFLTQGGKVYQTGTLHGFVSQSPTIVSIPLPIPAVELAAGRHFCLARMQGGIAVCSWGAGHFGQLGIGPAPGDSPQQQPVTFTSRPILIEHLLPRAIGSHVVQIAAGDWHGLALTESGMVWGWGSNRSQQCGRKHKSQTSEETPTLVVPTPVPLDVEMGQIAAGRSHSLALSKGSQQVYSWGSSIHGQCGHTVRRTPQPPRLIEGMRDLTIAKIQAGGNHSLALTVGGRLFAWGQQTEGQLGLGPAYLAQAKPRLVAELDFVAIVAGQELKRTQQQQQQHGISTAIANGTDAKSVESPLRSIPRIVDIFAGPSYSVAISSSGHAYCFGSNDAGQLGLPTPKDLTIVDNSLPAGPNPNEQKEKHPPEVHVQTFDSRHNVLLPTRQDFLVGPMRVRTVACGPNHLWFIGHENNEEYLPLPVGRTLYEIQQQKRTRPKSDDLNKNSTSADSTMQASQKEDPPGRGSSEQYHEHQSSREQGTRSRKEEQQESLHSVCNELSQQTQQLQHATIHEGEPLHVVETSRSRRTFRSFTPTPSNGERRTSSAPVSPSLLSRASPQSGPRAIISRLNKLRKRLGGSARRLTDISDPKEEGPSREKEQEQEHVKRNSM